LFCFGSLLPVFLLHDNARIGSILSYVLCRESRAVMALPACFREFFIRHWATFVPHSNEQRNAPLTRYSTSAPMRLFAVSWCTCTSAWRKGLLCFSAPNTVSPPYHVCIRAGGG
jgi:hypothetical protein